MWFRGGSRGCPGGFFGKNRPAPWRGGGIRGALPSRGNGGARGRTSSAPPIRHLHGGPWQRVLGASPRPPGVSPSPKPFPLSPWNRVRAHRGLRPPTGRTGSPPRPGCARGEGAGARRSAGTLPRPGGVHAWGCVSTRVRAPPAGTRLWAPAPTSGTSPWERGSAARLRGAARGGIAGPLPGAGTGAVTPGPDPPRGLSPAWKFSGETPPRANFGRSALGKGAAGAPVASSRPALSLLSRCLLHLFPSLSFFLTSSLCFPSFPSFLARAFSSSPFRALYFPSFLSFLPVSLFFRFRAPDGFPAWFLPLFYLISSFFFRSPLPSFLYLFSF